MSVSSACFTNGSPVGAVPDHCGLSIKSMSFLCRISRYCSASGTGNRNPPIGFCKLTREQMTAWFEQFRHGNPANRDFQKRLIDTFVNAVYVFDDKLVLTYNYQHGTQTISIDEIESALSSDFDGATPPKPEIAAVFTAAISYLTNTSDGFLFRPLDGHSISGVPAFFVYSGPEFGRKHAMVCASCLAHVRR